MNKLSFETFIIRCKEICPVKAEWITMHSTKENVNVFVFQKYDR